MNQNFWVSFLNFGNCFVRSSDGWVFCEEWPQFVWFVDSWKKLVLQSISPIIIHASEAKKIYKRTRNWKADSDQLKRTKKNRLSFNYKITQLFGFDVFLAETFVIIFSCSWMIHWIFWTRIPKKNYMKIRA